MDLVGECRAMTLHAGASEAEEFPADREEIGDGEGPDRDRVPCGVHHREEKTFSYCCGGSFSLERPGETKND